VEHIVFATGYCEATLRASLPPSSCRFDFCLNEAYERTQNSISLVRCADAVRGEAFVKLDGDLVLDQRIIQRVVSDTSPVSVAVDRTRPLDAEAMKVQMGAGESVADFGKALPLDRAQAESVGIESIDAQSASEVFGRIAQLERAGQLDRYYEDVYAELIRESRIAARAVEVSPLAWTEVDTFDDLAHARALIEARRV
jgi:choline kinase